MLFAVAIISNIVGFLAIGWSTRSVLKGRTDGHCFTSLNIYVLLRARPGGQHVNSFSCYL